MKSDWGKHYMAVVFSEMESFLSDLAGVTLSAEYEKRRISLEKKLFAVKKISTPFLLHLPSGRSDEACKNRQEEIHDKLADLTSMARPRSWSCPALSECLTAPEKNELQDGDQSELKMKRAETAFLKTEKELSEEKDNILNEELRNKKKIERLRQAYVETLRVPRRRAASEPQVRTTSSNHRVPNPEYIQGINTGTAFTLDPKKATEFSRKPNRKGFNVVWNV